MCSGFVYETFSAPCYEQLPAAWRIQNSLSKDQVEQCVYELV